MWWSYSIRDKDFDARALRKFEDVELQKILDEDDTLRRILSETNDRNASES